MAIPSGPTTIWEVFEKERPKLIPYRGRFDGFHALGCREPGVICGKFEPLTSSVQG